MREILGEIFENNNFSSILNEIYPEKNPYDELIDICVNELDEMYFIVSGKLDKDSLNNILEICEEEEKNKKYSKAYKSNWVVLYISKLQGKISEVEKTYVMNIEENKFFCRKYVFWYTDKEIEALKQLCGGKYTNENMSLYIRDYVYFCEFKKGENLGYDCLSRIYIKLPFLNLETIQTTNETIRSCIERELNELGEGIKSDFFSDTVESILSKINVSERELEKINKGLEGIKEGK